MARIMCEDCNSCVIKKECDAIDDGIYGIVDYSELLSIYEHGKADGRKEAIEEFKSYLLKHKKIVRELGLNHVYEAVKAEFIADTNESELKEQKTNEER